VIRKLYALVAFFSLALVLALGGLSGYLLGTGKLSGERMDAIAAILRGETREAAPVAASQPASSQAVAGRAPTADELRLQRRQEHLRRAVLEGATRDLAAQRDLLDRATAELMSREEQFDRSKEEWAREQVRMQEAGRDEGFERELKYVSSLAPRQAKDHLVKTWTKRNADGVRMLAALDPSKGKRILEQLKTPQELQVLHELLEQLRTQENEKSPAAPRTAASGSTN